MAIGVGRHAGVLEECAAEVLLARQHAVVGHLVVGGAVVGLEVGLSYALVLYLERAVQVDEDGYGVVELQHVRAAEVAPCRIVLSDVDRLHVLQEEGKGVEGRLIGNEGGLEMG